MQLIEHSLISQKLKILQSWYDFHSVYGIFKHMVRYTSTGESTLLMCTDQSNQCCLSFTEVETATIISQSEIKFTQISTKMLLQGIAIDYINEFRCNHPTAERKNKSRWAHKLVTRTRCWNFEEFGGEGEFEWKWSFKMNCGTSIASISSFETGVRLGWSEAFPEADKEELLEADLDRNAFKASSVDRERESGKQEAKTIW